MKASNIEKSSPKISNISFDNHHLMIEIDFKERTEQLLVINRETQEEYYIDQTSNFTYKLNLSMFNQSTWDFYIKNKDNHYRIKTSDEKPLGESYIFYNNKTNSLMNIKPYKTVKGSFSLSILNDTVKLENLKTFKEHTNVSIGGFFRIINPDFIDLDSIKLKLKRNGEEEYLEFPVEMQESSIQSLYMIKSNLDYTKFTRDSIEPDKWHAYLELSNEHLIRLQIDEGSFEAETSYLFTDYPYYICLYQTVNENLSVKIERLKIMRDVKSFELNNHRLELRGNSYFINELNSQRFKKEIIIKQRYSNQKVKFQPDYNGNEFYCSISLKHLFIFNSDKQPILDLYIRYSNDHYFIERKLGEENYQFYKDGVLGKGIIRDKSTFNYFYLTNTPSGNLKLQIFSISLLKHLYLRYFQDLDRKLFKHQDVWLVGERYDTAQDTGYYFFKYCREHHPRKKVYYVIDSNSKDVKNLKPYRKVIKYGSFKHFRLSAIAKKFIGSHEIEYFLPMKAIEFSSYKLGKRIFLQHGVLGRRKVEYYKSDYQYPFHRFIVSSDDEKQLVTNEMGYKPKEVKVTGLTRFDGLYDYKGTNQKSILLMPTWRYWLNNERKFLNSEYFSRYHHLLSDPKLHHLLEEHNVELNFYPHYRVQPYIKYFSQDYHKNIHLVELGEKSVQQLLLNHGLLITDYSSVSIDFNYLNRPVIFYHFDFDKFFENGILRAPEHTFIGDIVKENEELINRIKYYLENDLKERKDLGEVKNKLFKSQDRLNSKRVYKVVNNA